MREAAGPPASYLSLQGGRIFSNILNTLEKNFVSFLDNPNALTAQPAFVSGASMPGAKRIAVRSELAGCESTDFASKLLSTGFDALMCGRPGPAARPLFAGFEAPWRAML